MTTTTPIAEQIIQAWVTKISEKMKKECAAYVEFIGDIDFKDAELHWIEKTLFPALKNHGMIGYFRSFNKKGSSFCDHNEGRIFAVTLM